MDGWMDFNSPPMKLSEKNGEEWNGVPSISAHSNNTHYFG
jgi:hypothetical protein